MINYFENDYSVPIILGGNTDGFMAADVISRHSDKEIHVFSNHLSIFKKIRFTFHKVPRSLSLLPKSLLDFAGTIHEYYTPILIFSSEYSEFIEENRALLESFYIIIPASEIKQYFSETLKE